MEDKNKTISVEEHEALKQEILDFTYAISHDFNAPLRHIREFSKLLTHKLGDRLNEDEAGYVRIIDKSVRKAELMLEGLLKLSRLNTEAKDFEIADLNEVLEESKQALGHSVEAYGIKITSDELPSINCDREQIRKLFYQLLDNSVKFRKQDSQTEIDISATKNGNKYLFTIADNGTEIDHPKPEELFNLYRKNHQDNDIKGEGVGLTICQKIVHRHGGEIWFEPTNSGTKICFTLI